MLVLEIAFIGLSFCEVHALDLDVGAFDRSMRGWRIGQLVSIYNGAPHQTAANIYSKTPKPSDFDGPRQDSEGNFSIDHMSSTWSVGIAQSQQEKVVREAAAVSGKVSYAAFSAATKLAMSSIKKATLEKGSLSIFWDIDCTTNPVPLTQDFLSDNNNIRKDFQGSNATHYVSAVVHAAGIRITIDCDFSNSVSSTEESLQIAASAAGNYGVTSVSLSAASEQAETLSNLSRIGSIKTHIESRGVDAATHAKLLEAIAPIAGTNFDEAIVIECFKSITNALGSGTSFATRNPLDWPISGYRLSPIPRTSTEGIVVGAIEEIEAELFTSLTDRMRLAAANRMRLSHIFDLSAPSLKVKYPFEWLSEGSRKELYQYIEPNRQVLSNLMNLGKEMIDSPHGLNDTQTLVDSLDLPEYQVTESVLTLDTPKITFLMAAPQGDPEFPNNRGPLRLIFKVTDQSDFSGGDYSFELVTPTLFEKKIIANEPPLWSEIQAPFLHLGNGKTGDGTGRTAGYAQTRCTFDGSGALVALRDDSNGKDVFRIKRGKYLIAEYPLGGFAVKFDQWAVDMYNFGSDGMLQRFVTGRDN